MANYKTTITSIANNDAVIEAVAVALTIRNWAKAAYAAGVATRVWWENDETVAPLIRLAGQIIWLALVLAWSYFADGKAQQHWVFINNVVDDGLGLYGQSHMGEAVTVWSRKTAHCLAIATVRTMAYVVSRLGSAIAVRYGKAQAAAFG